MKYILTVILFALHLSGCIQQSKKYDRTTVINELIGDESYEHIYGHSPDDNAPDYERIKAHLTYVEQLLRKKDAAHLSEELKTKRLRILDLLHEYMLAGQYPKNYDIKGKRRPCFLDKDGNICAVGYLVEQTHSLTLACKINSEYKYDWVSDMDMPELNDWITNSGLTKEEFSLIQPSYENNGPFITSDAVAVPVVAQLSAFNIVTTCINGKQMADGRTSNLAPILGISTGALNIGYSALSMNNGGSPIAFFGFLTGTASIATSTANLIFKKKLDKSNISLSSNIFLTPDNKYTPGISLAIRL